MKLNITSIYENKDISTATFISSHNDTQRSTGIFTEQRIRIESQNYYSRNYIEDKDFVVIKYPELQNDL